MKEILAAAATYLPIDRRLALLNNRTIPETVHGAALFADCSGFTPLTIALAQDLGRKRGAEEVLRQINPIFEALIAELHLFGGSVIGFAGDAITCWLDDDPVVPLAGARQMLPGAQRAVACAFAMQRAMARFATVYTPTGKAVHLGVKIAIAAGATRRFAVGNPEIVVVDALAGKTLERMAAAEKLADTGEIVVSEEVLTGWPDPPGISEWREKSGKRFAVLNRLAAPVPATSWPDVAVGRLPVEQVKAWLLPAVYNLIENNRILFGDLRPVIPLFLNFSGIDYDADPLAGQKLDDYVRWVQGIVAKHHGSFIQLTIGDKGAFMYAAFGAPRLREDDANQAVAAGLALQNLPPELGFIRPVGIGITWGQVWTGNCGATSRHCYAVMGNQVNMSARLMGKANPGQVLVTQAVAEMADAFLFNDLGQIQVKGREEPLPVAEARQYRSLGLGLNIPSESLFGREALFAELSSYLTRVGQSQGQIISLAGERGMGKSHVACELVGLAAKAGFRDAYGICRSIQVNTPYYVWAQILAELFELPCTDPVEQSDIRHRQDLADDLQARVAAVHQEWLPRAPLLGDILNMTLEDTPLTAGLDPRARQQSLFDLLIEILQTLAAERPLLLLFDDTHWLDPGSAALIEALAPALVDSRILLLLLHRPLLSSEDPLTVLEKHDHYHAILLEGLPKATVAALIEHQLLAPLSPLALDIIYLIAAGNPLFTQELTDFFQATGRLVKNHTAGWELSLSFQDALRGQGCLQRVDDGPWHLASNISLEQLGLDLPDSVLNVVLSHLDRLSEKDKSLLKMASVYGHEFEAQRLADLSAQAGNEADITPQLARLQRDNFIYLQKNGHYQFKNSSYQEALYDSLLFSQRRQLHQHIARQYEKECGELPLPALTLTSPGAVYYPLLAHHWHYAEAPRQESVYAFLAGRQMALKFANRRAESYFTRALALTPETQPVHRYALHVEREKVNNWQAAREAQAEDLAAMAELVSYLDDAEQLIHVHMRQANYQRMLGYYKESVDHLQQVLALAEQHGLPQYKTAALPEWGRILWQQGRFQEADTLLQKALLLAEEQDDQPAVGRVLMDLSSTHYYLGHTGRMEQYARRALTIFERIEDVHGSIGILINLALNQADQGKIEAALDANNQALRLCNRVGYRQGKTFVLGNLGFIYELVGVYEESARCQEEARLLCRELGDREGEAFSLYNLGLVAVRQEQFEQAEAYFKQALALAEAIDYRLGRALTLAFWARALEGQHQWAQAEALYEQARQIHEAANQPGHVVEAQGGLARVALAQGDLVTARTLALAIWARLEEAGQNGIYYPGELYLTCYNVLRAWGQTDPADRALAEDILAAGQAYLQALAGQITDPALRHAFLEQVAAHRRLLRST